MEQKLNSVSSAETNDEVSANVDVTTSSPNNAKPHVVGSLTEIFNPIEIKITSGKPTYYLSVLEKLEHSNFENEDDRKLILSTITEIVSEEDSVIPFTAILVLISHFLSVNPLMLHSYHITS